MQTQINGGTQIQLATITNAQLSASAGITDGQLAGSYLYANGSRALTGNLQGGAHIATNFATPVASGDLATKGYVDSIASGISSRHSALCATTGAESFTIASGKVTVINNSAIDGIAPIIGAYILVKDAPAVTGTGSAGSSQPANGLYVVTSGSASTWNVSLDTVFSSSNPSGATVFVESGTAGGATGWIVTAPLPAATYTPGTTAVKFTQTSAAISYTTDATLNLAGTVLSRAAITGNVSIPAGSNTATIPSGTVTTAMLSATGTASSTTFLRGDGTWSTALQSIGAGSITFAMLATAATTTSTGGISSSSTDTTVPTAKAVYSYVTSAMAGAGAGTVTTVSVTSANGFAGSVATSSSTPAITISTTVTGMLKGNGTAISAATAGTDYVVPSGNVATATKLATPRGVVTDLGKTATTYFDGSQDADIPITGTLPTSYGGTGAAGSISGIVKGNGTSAFSAAVAGTDYVAPGSLATVATSGAYSDLSSKPTFVTRETPSGTPNGSTTAFTLAHTPILGTESVFLNGLLQDAGTGNDYNISTTTITFLSAPQSGDKIRVNYQY